MKPKSLVLLVVAAGCGLVAMLGVQQLLSAGNQTAQVKTRILIARTDIDAGISLDKSNVTFKEWPEDALPEGAITKPEEYAERALKHRVGPGQPIVVASLGSKGDFGLSALIPQGMTVVTYPATASMTHSGLLKPGTYVDVSAAIDYQEKSGAKRTEVRLVLQCVKVIAVGSKTATSELGMDATAKDSQNVSFCVFPLQGQILQLAYKKSNGSIQLALRGKSDKTNANVSDLTEQQLNSLSNKLFGDFETNPSINRTVELVSTPKSKPSIHSFLKRQMRSAVTSVGEQSVRKSWKIEIYNGDKKEVQEIEISELEAAKMDLPHGSTSAGVGWADPILKFFSQQSKKMSNPSTSKEAVLKDTVKRSDYVDDHRTSSLNCSPAHSAKNDGGQWQARIQTKSNRAGRDSVCSTTCRISMLKML